MALLAHVGTFARATSTGAQSISTLAFQPKALVFFMTRQTATGFNSSFVTCVGISAGSGQSRSVCFASDQASTTNVWQRMTTAAVSYVQSGAGTLDSEGLVTSLSTNGFTITWSTVSANADRISYLAIGGDAITNSTVGDNAFSTVTGNQAVSALSFQGDVGLFIGVNGAGALPINTGTDAGLGVGMAVSGSERGARALGTRNARTDLAAWAVTQESSRCHRAMARSALVASFDFVSWNANGFTLNLTTDVAGGAITAQRVGYLVLKGGLHAVRTLTQPTSSGTQASTHGFTPVGVLFSAYGSTGSTTVSNRACAVAGAMVSSVAQAAVAVVEPTINNANMVNQSTSAIFVPSTNAALAEASFQSFDADGFTLNWTAVDSSNRSVLYWAMGSSAVGGGGGIFWVPQFPMTGVQSAHV